MQLDAIINQLRAFQGRKEMYIGKVSLERAECWLYGFWAGCSVSVFPMTRENRTQATEQRGWKARAMGPVPQMRKKGLSDEQIIDELIEIEIEAYRLALSDDENELQK